MTDKETLEEYIERETQGLIEPNLRAAAKAFLNYGAKWQMERSYSEDEVRFIAFQFHYEMSRYMKVPSWYMPDTTIEKERIFEKFKKK